METYCADKFDKFDKIDNNNLKIDNYRLLTTYPFIDFYWFPIQLTNFLSILSIVIDYWFYRLNTSEVNLSNAKNSAWFFFPGLINLGDQEPLCLLNVIEDDCYFLGVHMRLSTRCKIWFTLGIVRCLQIISL